ncbi:MAG: HlyD family efflux transporter periplasmic adaptor subunit [Phycisphaerales bacterium]|nr:HlyD family efflux transporter periplasmic adaptor subunit [Phycisphaerales bacterium]
MNDEKPQSKMKTQELFRQGALDHHREQRHGSADVLHLSDKPLRPLFFALSLTFSAGLAYLVMGRVDHYAEGPAVVQISDRTEITAVVEGVVQSIHVVPGQAVCEGQLLASFRSDIDLAELERTDLALSKELVGMLRDPSNNTVRNAFASLHTERQYILRRLRNRAILAPRGGIVSDVSIRPGQSVSPGDGILALAGSVSQVTVLVVLPGRYRPQIERGMEIRIELAGYRHAYQRLKVDYLTDEIIGDAALRRYLPTKAADTIAVSEPVVLLHGTLPGETFHADGVSYRYYHGMVGKASTRVRSESLLVTLVPAFKYLFEASDD